MQKHLKNSIPYVAAMIIVGSLVFILLYVVFRMNRADALFYAVLCASAELGAKGLVYLYRLISKKTTG